ncbi:PaaX family transcriptional regulator C-terminal domain-containing protein [Micromonospora sp. NPDC050980]|uniref:PaaX family transcriptional regulator n=1 Tax=Micromonospora sp. NPDC050980 TaxID=3155161 RepID=UPI0033FAD5F4
MASAFDIEEIYPDDGETSIRLPRRQAGPAPQGMTVTLLTDYTLRTRAALPSAAIVALLAEAGVTSAGARTAISRLARRGVLERSRQGRNSSYRLSRGAAADLSAGGNWILTSTTAPPAWDGCWTLVAFSLPQELAAQRRALRGQLRWLGFAPLYDGLWVSPHELTPPGRSLVSGLAPGAVTVIRGRHAALDVVGQRAPVEAWDIAGIGRQYEEFLRRWTPLASRTDTVDGPAAVRARTEVMDTYRRFPTLDPRLPLDLLPAGWPRQGAHEVFTAVYDGLAETAERHVRAVVARHAGAAPPPDVRAHTTADMLAGVRPDGRGTPHG